MRKSGSVRIGSTDMYYVSFGSGSRNLIVLPGLSDGLATVKGKGLILSVSYRRFMKDYTVFMFSRKNDMPKGYSIRDMAADQILAMDRLGIEQAGVLGVSQGGLIAQYMAIDHPERIEYMILTVTAPYANQTVKSVISGWIEMACRDDHAGLMADTAEKMYSDSYLQKYRRMNPLLALFTKPRSYDRFLKNAEAILSFDARSELGKIQCPVLIIAGSTDRIVGSEAAKELNTAVKWSELYVYEGLGHGAFEEAKDFYERVYDFCQRM